MGEVLTELATRYVTLRRPASGTMEGRLSYAPTAARGYGGQALCLIRRHCGAAKAASLDTRNGRAQIEVNVAELHFRNALGP
jgi:hypothetical protein